MINNTGNICGHWEQKVNEVFQTWTKIILIFYVQVVLSLKKNNLDHVKCFSRVLNDWMTFTCDVVNLS